MSWLEQNTIKKRQVDEPISQIKLDEGNSKEYKVEVICDNEIYIKKSDSGHLQGLYYLIFWKNYLEKENTWEYTWAIQYFWRLITISHNEHSKKPIATSR